MGNYTYLPFKDWANKGEVQPGLKSRRLTGIKRVSIHHTVIPSSGRTPCQNFNLTWTALKGRKLRGYNVLHDPSGVTGELNGPRTGEHTKGFNSSSLALSFCGDFTRETPSLAAIIAAANTINMYRLAGILVPNLEDIEIVPHSALVATACPGPTTLHLGDSGSSLCDWIRWFAANPPN